MSGKPAARTHHYPSLEDEEDGAAAAAAATASPRHPSAPLVKPGRSGDRSVAPVLPFGPPPDKAFYKTYVESMHTS